MEINRKDIIVKGRYNVWDLKDWLSIILFLVIIAIGLFLLTSPDLRKYSYYPLGGGLLILAYILFRIAFLGNFQVSRQNIVWKTSYSSIESLAFDKIGSMHLEYNAVGKAFWHVLNHSGQKIKKFRSISPVPAAGAAILFFRYKDLLPEIVFNIWKPLSKGKRTYEEVNYKVKIDGSTVQEAKGSIVLYENKLLFIPTAVEQELTESARMRVLKAQLIPDHIKYAPDANIKTHTMIEAIIESNFPIAIRDAYIQKIVNENGGNIFVDITRTGKQWQTYNEGVEIIITRA